MIRRLGLATQEGGRAAGMRSANSAVWGKAFGRDKTMKECPVGSGGLDSYWDALSY